MDKIKSRLTDVPETMLWTLHNRASEAMRDDSIIDDPHSVRIYQSIDYDYERSFGKASPSHAIRSLLFDEQVRKYLKIHPDGVVVNLGEGLETQRFRVEGEQATWISIDLPEAMAVREQFIEADAHHLHLPYSVLDRQWFTDIPNGLPIFITAQGLLMYLPEDEVRQLFQDLAKQFPGSWLLFDSIPKWLSKRTMNGWKKTEYYTTPQMPWGVNKPEIESTLRNWVPTLVQVEDLELMNYPRGIGRYFYPIMKHLPFVKSMSPAITLIRFG